MLQQDFNESHTARVSINNYEDTLVCFFFVWDGVVK